MRWCSLAFWWWVAMSALAGWQLASLVPKGVRQAERLAGDFVLPVDKPQEVTPARWWLIPYLFADFDLHADVELGEATELELLLRQVEPRYVDGQLLPFHGRFTALRLSTAGAGPAWRSRDEALLGDARGGVDLAAGIPATVLVQARGRLLRASVAGRWSPWVTADDHYGMATLIARSGKVVVRSLRIVNLGQPDLWKWSPWFWAALGGVLGAALGAAALASGVRLPWFAAGALLPPVAAWWVVGRVSFDLAWPPLPVMTLLLLVCLLCSWLVAGWRLLVLAAVAGLLAGFAVEQRLLRDDHRVDAVFGPRAGSQLSEAIGQRVRGSNGLHDIGHPHAKVFLLGGQLLYDRSLTGTATPIDHLERLLPGELQRLGLAVDVPCLPTVDGHTAQQWALFKRFFTGFRPKVVVFGVGAAEGVDGRSTPARLEATLSEAVALCQLWGSRLVVFAEAEVEAPFLAVLRGFGPAVPLVTESRTTAPAAIAKSLGSGHCIGVAAMMPSPRVLALRDLVQQDGPASIAAAAARRELLALHAAGQLTGPADRALAAELLLEGDPDETRIAEQLALSAAARIATARPLAARAFDRLRMQRGQPQKFGTAILVRDGKSELWPVDPNTTDSERAKWGLPALAVLAMRAAAVTP